MKKYILMTCLLLTFSTAWAQKVPYEVVFDLTSSDTVVHQMVVRWVKGVIASSPDARVEVVLYGKSLDMVTIGKSVVADEIVKLAANKNVAFSVCESAMKRNKVDKTQLLTGVGTVPDGIYEIILRQHDGWGYIKASR